MTRAGALAAVRAHEAQREQLEPLRRRLCHEESTADALKQMHRDGVPADQIGFKVEVYSGGARAYCESFGDENVNELFAAFLKKWRDTLAQRWPVVQGDGDGWERRGE